MALDIGIGVGVGLDFVKENFAFLAFHLLIAMAIAIGSACGPLSLLLLFQID